MTYERGSSSENQLNVQTLSRVSTCKGLGMYHTPARAPFFLGIARRGSVPQSLNQGVNQAKITLQS
jgi:hypothetical protein